MGLKVYIIDDEEKMGELIARGLSRHGHETAHFTRPDEALKSAAAVRPDVILTDLKMPGMSGVDVLEHARRTFPNTDVVLMTAYASAQSAVEALKKGAYDYLIKPFPIEELVALLERLGERTALRAENARLRETLAEWSRFENLVAVSAPMRDVVEKMRRVAPTDASVLLRGESGTGKEVVATAIHSASPRAEKPLVRVNCGAIPETLLESALFGHMKGAFTGADRDQPGFFRAADGGTLFLDEIGELSPQLQVKLLRALQDGTFSPVGSSEQVSVNVRVIAATNRDLEAAMAEGNFRQDLYYRLNVVPIALPPLRERRDDIVPLIDFFLARLAQRGRRAVPFSRDALDAMRRYSWPGNIRELQNAVEHATVMTTGDQIEVKDLPQALQQFAGEAPLQVDLLASLDGSTLEQVEKLMIERALEAEGWNQTHAARRLGITRRTLGYRMARHGIPSKSSHGHNGADAEDSEDEDANLEESQTGTFSGTERSK